MFYLLPNMPPILESSGQDEVAIAMVEFEKKKSLKRYSRYGATIPEDKTEKDKLANFLLKDGEISIAGDERREYDNISKKMACAKRIQYAAGFVTLIAILIVLIVTTIRSGYSPSFKPHAPQKGHPGTNPSDLGFDVSIGQNAANLDDLDNLDNLNNIDNLDNLDNLDKTQLEDLIETVANADATKDDKIAKDTDETEKKDEKDEKVEKDANLEKNDEIDEIDEIDEEAD